VKAQRVSAVARTGVLVVIVVGAGLLFAAPLWWTFVWSTWHTAEIFSFPPKLIPGPDFGDNYAALQGSVGISRAFLNSVLVTGATLTGALVFCTLAGYAFAKFDFAGRSLLFGLVMATMVVPGQITVVPLFVTMVKLGWIDSYQGLILPGLVPALGVFFMRMSAQQSIPSELLEAARIDGAGELRIFSSIVVPALRPSMAALSILLFAGTWGALFWPVVVLRSTEMFTIPVALASLFGTATQPYDQLMVGSLLSIIPPLAIFFLLQKYFVKSIMLTGFK